MKNFCFNLKTSDKITFLFTIFNFISLIILLFWINIIYFFIWYSDQKKESLYDMNINYNNFIKENKHNSQANIDAFKEYILQKDTLIIPKDGSSLVCSNWVESKIHDNIEEIKDKYFYNTWEKIFFIYTKNYPEIWEVKVFFDTTPYVKSQIIIIKISLFIILFSLFLYIIIWKKITKYSFKQLNNIANFTKTLDIEKDYKLIKISWNKNDEVNILAETINKSFCHIKDQTINLKQFITNVSHEFKTPLMIIDSQIDLYNKKLEKNILSKNDTNILLNNIKSNTKNLNKLLETFMLLSRLENKLGNKIELLNKENINLEKYIKQITNNYILTKYNNKNKNKITDINNITENINIKFNLNPDINLAIEKNTFNILFENILSNAIKFSKVRVENLETKKNNIIKIEIWCNENSLWIKDNWIWINKKDLHKIWTKFFRSNDKDNLNVEWFWIWLFMAKRLCDLYWFKIKIKSIKKWNKTWTKFIIKF